MTKSAHNNITKSNQPLTHEQARAVILVASGILALALGLLAMAYKVETRSVKQLIAVPQTAVAINQSVSMGVVDLKVNKVTYESGQPPFIAPKGKRYAIVNVTILNKSDKPIQVLPSGDIYLKNSAGEVAYISPYSLDQPFRAGELSPGEQIKGDLSFLIHDNSIYKLYVDAIWSGGVIPFALQ